MSTLLLLLAACTQADPADKGDDTTDDTDVTDVPIVYEPVEPAVQWVRAEYQGVGYVTWGQPNPAAFALILHGTGGSGAGVVDTAEMVAILNELVTRGVAFVAPDALNRQTGQFDQESKLADNLDFQLLDHLRDDLITRAVITETTPMIALGFSAGGAFASYLGHAGPEAGWPLKAVLLHNASGWTSRYGKPSRLPHMWLCGDNDDVVEQEECDKRYQEHVDNGDESIWAPHHESRLYPTRFVRTTYFTPEQSQQVFNEAVRGGFWSEQGERLFPIEEADAQLADFTTNYDVIYAKPVTAQLNVVLGGHAINGEHAVQEAEFVLDHLTP